MQTAGELLKRIDFVELVRIGRQGGLYPEPVPFPESYDAFNESLRKVAFEVIRATLKGCYVRRNETSFSVRMDGDCLTKVKALEDALYLHKFPSPRIGTVLNEVKNAFSAFPDTRMRNGRRYIYIDHSVETMYNNRRRFSPSIALISKLGQVLDEASKCYDELAPQIDDHIQHRREEQKRIRDLQQALLEKRKALTTGQATEQNANLMDSIKAQLDAKRTSAQDKLNAAIAKTKERQSPQAAAAKEWVQPGDAVRVIIVGSPGVEHNWYVFPPEAEIALPPDAKIYATDKVKAILDKPTDKGTFIVTESGRTCNFDLRHWTQLSQLYALEEAITNRKPGLYYKPASGIFVVVANVGEEYQFATWMGADDFIRGAGLGINTTEVMLYDDPTKLAKGKEGGNSDGKLAAG